MKLVLLDCNYFRYSQSYPTTRARTCLCGT